MNKLDFTIDWYHKENERQNALNDSLNIPIGILTAIFALYSYLINEYGFETKINWLVTLGFILLLCLSAGFWLYVLYQLFRAYNDGFNGYTYQALPYPTVMNEYYQSLATFLEEHNDDKNLQDIDQLYDNQLHEMISGYLNVNIGNNDKKSYHIHTAKTNLLRCIIFLILSIIPFSFVYIHHKNNAGPQEVIIKNIEPLHSTKHIFKTIPDMSKQQIKPPPPPPPRLVKEGKEPTPPPPPKTRQK